MAYIYKEDKSNPNVQDGKPVADFFILTGGLAAILVLLYLAIGFISERAFLFIGPQTERSLLGSVSWSGGTEWSAGRELVERLLGSKELDVEVYVVDHGTLNAYAYPGRQVVVECSVLEKVSTENALAFVIAHELGHIHHRDNMRMLGRGLGLLLIQAALGMGGGNHQVATVAPIALHTRFSVAQELNADDFAIEVLRRAYGGTKGADEFFRAIPPGHDSPSFFNSHPATEERIRKLGRAAEQGNLVTLSPSYAETCKDLK
jgi:Zn-dependent protease with chaperone function